MKPRHALLSFILFVVLDLSAGAKVTTPLDHGFPDFGRQIAVADQRVLDEANVTINAQTTYGPFFVGNMPYIFFRSVTPVATYQATILWSSDGTIANEFGEDIIVAQPLDFVAQSIPVRGAFVRIVIDLSAYPNDHNTQAIMTSVPGNEISAQTLANVLMHSDGDVVGAGAVATYNPAYVHGGWIHWIAHFDGGVAYLIRLYAVKFDGTLRLLDVIGANSSRGGGLVLAPAYSLRLVASNFDGVARNFYMSVAYHPFYP